MWKKFPAVRFPLHVAACMGAFSLALPLTIALFPQTIKVGHMCVCACMCVCVCVCAYFLIVCSQACDGAQLHMIYEQTLSEEINCEEKGRCAWEPTGVELTMWPYCFVMLSLSLFTPLLVGMFMHWYVTQSCTPQVPASCHLYI